jgi:hypothetical protein
MLYVGVDLHRKRSVVAALDEAGTPVLSRRIESRPEAFQRIFGELAPASLSVAFEATYGWSWFADLLADAGIDLSDPTGLAASASDEAEGGQCDLICLANMYPPPAPQPEVNPCAKATGPCTYYLTGAPTGTVEVRVNEDGIRGWFVGAIGGSNNNVTFSRNLIVSNYNLDPRDPIISHELGHTIQAKMLQDKGLSYLLSYAVLRPGNDHRSYPMERDANLRAGLPVEFPFIDTSSNWKSPFTYSVQGHP